MGPVSICRWRLLSICAARGNIKSLYIMKIAKGSSHSPIANSRRFARLLRRGLFGSLNRCLIQLAVSIAVPRRRAENVTEPVASQVHSDAGIADNRSAAMLCVIAWCREGEVVRLASDEGELVGVFTARNRFEWVSLYKEPKQSRLDRLRGADNRRAQKSQSAPRFNCAFVSKVVVF